MKKITFVASTLMLVFVIVFASTLVNPVDVEAKKINDDGLEIIYEYYSYYHCLEDGDCTFKCPPEHIGYKYECYGGYTIAYIYEDGVFKDAILVSRTPFLGHTCECIPDVNIEDPLPQG